MSWDTGFPRADAEHDFVRARRREVLSRLTTRLRREPDDVNLVLPFQEAVRALGQTGTTDLGLRTIPLDSIVGSVDRTDEYDRRFRPTSTRMRQRWERLATAWRRGEDIPPIEVYRLGDLHFVQDGHHRVSIAHALKLDTIDAYVTEVHTRMPAEGIRRRGDLLVKDYERLFLDRVPLPPNERRTIRFGDPWGYAELAVIVEAWGFRCMQDEERLLDRCQVARRWYGEEYAPVVRMLREADLIGERTDAEAYLRVIRERYRLIRTHRWGEDVLAKLRDELA